MANFKDSTPPPRFNITDDNEISQIKSRISIKQTQLSKVKNFKDLNNLLNSEIDYLLKEDLENFSDNVSRESGYNGIANLLIKAAFDKNRKDSMYSIINNILKNNNESELKKLEIFEGLSDSQIKASLKEIENMKKLYQYKKLGDYNRKNEFDNMMKVFDFVNVADKNNDLEVEKVKVNNIEQNIADRTKTLFDTFDKEFLEENDKGKKQVKENFSNFERFHGLNKFFMLMSDNEDFQKEMNKLIMYYSMGMEDAKESVKNIDFYSILNNHKKFAHLTDNSLSEKEIRFLFSLDRKQLNEKFINLFDVMVKKMPNSFPPSMEKIVDAFNKNIETTRKEIKESGIRKGSLKSIYTKDSEPAFASIYKNIPSHGTSNLKSAKYLETIRRQLNNVHNDARLKLDLELQQEILVNKTQPSRIELDIQDRFYKMLSIFKNEFSLSNFINNLPDPKNSKYKKIIEENFPNITDKEREIFEKISDNLKRTNKFTDFDKIKKLKDPEDSRSFSLTKKYLTIWKDDTFDKSFFELISKRDTNKKSSNQIGRALEEHQARSMFLNFYISAKDKILQKSKEGTTFVKNLNTPSMYEIRNELIEYIKKTDNISVVQTIKEDLKNGFKDLDTFKDYESKDYDMTTNNYLIKSFIDTIEENLNEILKNYQIEKERTLSKKEPEKDIDNKQEIQELDIFL